MKLPLTYENNEFTHGGRVVSLGEAARLRAHADRSARNVLGRAFVKRYPAPSGRLPTYLDPHQVDGVSWVLTRSRSYLAHAPGAGKTCQAVTAAILAGKALKAEGELGVRAIFIVPPSLTANWAREVTHWATLLGGKDYFPTLYVVRETKHAEVAGWQAEFIIVPDSMLTKPWVLASLHKTRFHFLAVDEASRFKERKAERTRALFGGKLKSGVVSSGLVYMPKHAVLLDGSPMPNRPMELWAPTFAMSPESIDFMDESAFGFRYCGATINKFGRWEFKNDSNLIELKEKLHASFMHTVPESRLNHPERVRRILPMSGDPRSARFKRWENKFLHTLNLNEIGEESSQGELATLRAELGMSKVNWSARYIAERLTIKNESLLIFCWHREVAFELEKLLKKFRPGLVIGGTDADEREASLLDFQTGRIKPLIMNIASGGRGHNCQRADRVVFVEYSWTDETNKQAEKRASRRGNEKKNTPCDYIVVPNSLDERILNSVFKKAGRVRKVFGE